MTPVSWAICAYKDLTISITKASCLTLLKAWWSNISNIILRVSTTSAWSTLGFIRRAALCYCIVMFSSCVNIKVDWHIQESALVSYLWHVGFVILQIVKSFARTVVIACLLAECQCHRCSVMFLYIGAVCDCQCSGSSVCYCSPSWVSKEDTCVWWGLSNIRPYLFILKTSSCDGRKKRANIQNGPQKIKNWIHRDQNRAPQVKNRAQSFHNLIKMVVMVF